MFSARRISGADIAVVLLAMVLAIATLSFRLSWQDYWWDEHVTLMFTRSGWHELMVQYWGLDTHRPVYYGLQKAWNGVFGESVTAVRSLPIFLTVLIIPLFYGVARRTGPAIMAPLAVILLASAPMFIEQGREARMYCLMNLSLAGALYLAVRLAVHARQSEYADGMNPRAMRWLWVGFAALQAAAFYAQAMALFVSGLFGLWIIIGAATGLLPKRFLWQAMVAAGLYVILILPALQPFLGHYQNTIGGSFWVPDLSVEYVYGQTTAAYPYPAWGKVIVALLLLWGLWSLRKTPDIGLLLGLMMVGLPLVVLAVSFVKPIYMERVIAWGSIVSILVLAAGLVNMRPALRWAAVVVVLVAQMISAYKFYPPAPEISPYDSFAEAFTDFDVQQDALVLSYQMLEPAMRWYYPEAFEGAAYGFIHNDWNRNVIDAAMRSKFVKRADAGKIVLPGGRLFVVSQTTWKEPIPKEHEVTQAIKTLVEGRAPLTTITADGVRMDIYPPK